MSKLIRFDTDEHTLAPDLGFAAPEESGRRSVALSELAMTLLLAACIMVAATAVTFGVVGPGAKQPAGGGSIERLANHITVSSARI